MRGISRFVRDTDSICRVGLPRPKAGRWVLLLPLSRYAEAEQQLGACRAHPFIGPDLPPGGGAAGPKGKVSRVRRSRSWTRCIESAEAKVFPEPAAPELSPECKALMDSPSEAFAACRANPGRGHGCGNCVRTNIADFVGCIEGPGGTRPMQSYCQSLQEAANPRPPGPPPPPPPPQVAYCLVKVVVEPAIHICACLCSCCSPRLSAPRPSLPSSSPLMHPWAYDRGRTAVGWKLQRPLPGSGRRWLRRHPSGPDWRHPGRLRRGIHGHRAQREDRRMGDGR